MIAIPAIDLRGGACVQLVGGSYDDERIRIANPLDAVRRWTDAGFRRLHVVDLDAATGAGTNAAAVVQIIEACAGIEVQVGGGVRSSERVAELLDAGAARVVVGTRAIEDRQWFVEVASRYPGRLILAADVRGRSVVTHGWAQASGRDVIDLLQSLEGLPLAGILVTAVDREGLMRGTDLTLMGEIAAMAPAPLIASGGITSIVELRGLEERGVAGAVLGMSLYTGALDARRAATEFTP